MLQETLNLVDEDDPLFRQRTLIQLGLAQRLTGATTAASQYYTEAVRLGRSYSRREPLFTMYALHALAFNLIMRGQRREALVLCEAAFSEFTDSRGKSLPTCNLVLVPLAACAYEANDLIQARDLARRGREEYQRLNLKREVGLEAEQILIQALAGLGDWDAAWRFIREARQVPQGGDTEQEQSDAIGMDMTEFIMDLPLFSLLHFQEALLSVTPEEMVSDLLRQVSSQ